MPVISALVIVLIIMLLQLGRTGDMGETMDFEAWPFLSTPSSSEEGVTWNKSGDLIAYMSEGDIWVCDYELTIHQNLTEELEGDATNPVWSPDGQRIAFYADYDGPGIYTMSLISMDARKVISTGSRISNYSMSWEAKNDSCYTQTLMSLGKKKSMQQPLMANSEYV